MNQVVSVLQVHNPGQRVRGFKAIPVHTHTWCGGELSADGVVVQSDGIVSRVSLFSGLPKSALVLVPPLVALPELGAGHDQHISIIADPGALQMGVAEPVNDAVRVMVATASIPAVQAGVGTELDHSEGRRGPGVGVAVSASADPRVDLLVQGFDVGAARRPCDSGQRQPGEASKKLAECHF